MKALDVASLLLAVGLAALPLAHVVSTPTFWLVVGFAGGLLTGRLLSIQSVKWHRRETKRACEELHRLSQMETDAWKARMAANYQRNIGTRSN